MAQLIKYLPLLLLLAVALWIFLFPSSLRGLLRKSGKGVGDVGRAGRELTTGQPVAGSPLSKFETMAGKAVEEKILAAHPIHGDAFIQDRVAFVGSRLLGGVVRREIPYRFRVIDAAEPVAFSLPGGAVLVSRSLVDLAGPDDNQLAGILAHEVVHIDQRHAVRRMAKLAAARTGLKLLSFGRGALLGRAVGSLEGFLEKGYGAEEELEADRLALALAARCGFDPRAWPFFLRSVLDRRLENAGYFRAHPPLPTRLRALGA
jgi:predicted Zn-dependent protease